MHPVLFKIGPITIFSYGLMVAIGFALALFLICRRANDFNIKRDDVLDIAIIVLISGLIGSRFLYVVLNVDYYINRPLEILDLSKGGLVWYGGFLTSLAVSAAYIKKRGLSFLNVADLFFPYAALAQAIGRVGCFLNGCCYGTEAPSGCPFSVVFPFDTVMRHPAQLYSALSLLGIFVILRIWQDRRRFPGEIFLGYCLLYSLKRFLMEFLRGDNSRMLLSMTLSQLVSLAVFGTAAAALIWRFSTCRRRT